MKRRRRTGNPASNVAPIAAPERWPYVDAIWHLAALAVTTLAVYLPALRNGFVTDDTLQMLSNPFVTSYHYIPRLFASDVWAFSGAPATTNYYRPLQMLVYMAEYYTFGFRPWPFHLINLLTGVAGVVAVYFLVRALASNASLALVAALLFALHPLHVEPMAWIASLPDLICGLFLFVALLLYHQARRGILPAANHVGAVACLLGGLFCKETALVFPAILVAYEFLYRGESVREIFSFAGLRRLSPYVGAVAFYILIRIRALGSFFLEASHRVTPLENVLSVPVLFARYVIKLFWPVHSNYYYYFVPESAPGVKFIASVLLIVALMAAMFRLRKRQPVLSFALAWFFITLAPALSIQSVSGMVFAERYAFIPSLGFCIFGAWAWLSLTRVHSRHAVVRAGAYSFAVLLFAFYVVQIERRLPYWHDDVRLLEDAARQSSGSADVQMQLGATYYRAGNYDLAVTHLERAMALGRADYQPHIFLALSLAPMGRSDEANAELLRAYDLKPARVPTWPVFGLAHAGLHQWDQAADCYAKAIQQNPGSQLMFELWGEALQEKGDVPGAIGAWQRALALQPGYLDASINLAVAMAQAGNTDEAITLLNAAIKANPREQHTADAYANLGTVYVHRGEWQAAESSYQQALNIDPDLTFARRSIDMIETRRHSQP